MGLKFLKNNLLETLPEGASQRLVWNPVLTI